MRRGVNIIKTRMADLESTECSVCANEHKDGIAMKMVLGGVITVAIMLLLILFLSIIY